jgi:hypothetical protein
MIYLVSLAAAIPFGVNNMTIKNVTVTATATCSPPAWKLESYSAKLDKFLLQISPPKFTFPNGDELLLEYMGPNMDTILLVDKKTKLSYEVKEYRNWPECSSKKRVTLVYKADFELKQY